jgi:hypothetical protein
MIKKAATPAVLPSGVALELRNIPFNVRVNYDKVIGIVVCCPLLPSLLTA